MDRKTKVKHIVFISVIVASILFIWSRSLTFADDSTAQSNWVKQLLVDFFNLFNFDITPTFFFKNLRKFAHFAEFFVLGCELALYRYAMFKNNKKTLCAIVATGVAVAIADECIQLIPALERDGKLTDVLIDTCGVLCAVLVVYLATRLISKFKFKSTLHSKKNMV